MRFETLDWSNFFPLNLLKSVLTECFCLFLSDLICVWNNEKCDHQRNQSSWSTLFFFYYWISYEWENFILTWAWNKEANEILYLKRNRTRKSNWATELSEWLLLCNCRRSWNFSFLLESLIKKAISSCISIIHTQNRRSLFQAVFFSFSLYWPWTTISDTRYCVYGVFHSKRITAGPE